LIWGKKILALSGFCTGMSGLERKDLLNVRNSAGSGETFAIIHW